MNKLFNIEGQEVPYRPMFRTMEVRHEVLETAVNTMIEGGLFQCDEREDLICTLKKHYYSIHTDEYDLAKDFDDEGWDVDRDFVSTLEEVNWEISKAFDDIVKKWYDVNQPLPPFVVGTRLTVKTYGKTEGGTIEGIYDRGPAKYLVKMDNQVGTSTSRIIDFEEAEAEDAN